MMTEQKITIYFSDRSTTEQKVELANPQVLTK